MHFQIEKHTTPAAVTEENIPRIIPATETFRWHLLLASGERVAQGPRVFYDEKECRSQLAAAKKSMKGALRCKVLSPE